ncbi:MAG TPA: MBL fold metallo-hydrolase [Acidimicrobiaceae bacterium]|nr:MBL fold metallo-hydrolase [Acidimicrobiaceae bacterium]
MNGQPVSPAALVALGAAGTVTGSKFLLEHGTARVLFDCGLYQGLKELRERNWAEFPVDPATIDAVVISHGHLDHCGYLPRLVKGGFRGAVHVTYDTGRLMSVVLPDSGRLLEEEAKYANRAGYSKHSPALALYTEDDAWAALDLLAPQSFDEPFSPAPGVTVEFRPAGHILGSAIVRVMLDDGPTVVFSGDLGRPSHPLLVPPSPAGVADYLLVESTYGDREHVNGETPQRLAELINRTVDRGGVVVIPAFAVDRTEVLLYHLHQLSQAGSLPKVPISIDSPMALAALKIYREAFETKAGDVRPELHDFGELFDLPGLEEVHDAEGSKAVTRRPGPAIIIAGAGMASGGRVVHHLKRFLPDPANSVALVGFQAAGTRGRQLKDGASSVKIHGEYVRVRAEICDLTGFSVHADASELLDWVGTAEGRPTVFAVHGEPDAAEALRRNVEARFDLTAAVPRYGERLLLR